MVLSVISHNNKKKTTMIKRSVCSIVWDGLREGPKFSGRDLELKKMTEEFLAKHGKEEDPVKFGQEMRNFAEEHGFEVEDNVYLDSRMDEAMTEAEEKEFLKALRAGKVKFSYKKVDGTTREALGTLKPELIGKGATDKKVEDGKKKRHVPPTIIIYWDLEAAGFRSFRKDNFIKFKAVEDDQKDKDKDKDKDRKKEN